MSDGELPASGVPHGGVYARAAAFSPPSRRRLRPGRNNPFGNNPFVREPYPFHGHPGQEVLMVRFFGPDGEMVLHCYVHDLYDGEQMRPEKLETWRGLRERYGNRDESRVDQGTLLAPAAGTGEATGPCRLTATAANGWHQEGVGSWAGKLASVALSH